jgi:hypothetical protein
LDLQSLALRYHLQLNEILYEIKGRLIILDGIWNYGM